MSAIDGDGLTVLDWAEGAGTGADTDTMLALLREAGAQPGQGAEDSEDEEHPSDSTPASASVDESNSRLVQATAQPPDTQLPESTTSKNCLLLNVSKDC